MSTQLQRLRIRPTWRSGLRRGRIRNEATLAFERCPEMNATLMRVIAEMDALGFDPVPMDRVKQPFDYDRRQTPPYAHRQGTACQSTFRAAGRSASAVPARPGTLD